MKNFSLILIVLSFCFFSCAGTGSKGFGSSGQVKVIDANFEKSLQATEGFLVQSGFQMTKVDRQTGEIETEYQSGVGWTTDFTGDKRAKIMAKVTAIDEKQSRLNLEILAEVRDEFSGWQLISADNRRAMRLYQRFLDGITKLALSF